MITARWPIGPALGIPASSGESTSVAAWPGRRRGGHRRPALRRPRPGGRASGRRLAWPARGSPAGTRPRAPHPLHSRWPSRCPRPSRRPGRRSGRSLLAPRSARARPEPRRGRARRPAQNPREQGTRRPLRRGSAAWGAEDTPAAPGCTLASMAGKQYLMTPGPTPVPPQVLAALAEPVMHHRGPDFRPIFERCLERLRAVYQSASEPLLFTASGTGAMESVLANLTEPGDRVVVVSAGSFGERWLELARRQGCDVTNSLRYEWGEAPASDDLAARLRQAGGVKLVLLTHSETSTGAVADVRALAAEAQEAGALVAVDAVSSLGAVPLETDAWGLDAVVSGSQKALMTPPGLAFVAVSERAERAARPQPRTLYFDWARTRKAQDKRDSAFTPAVSPVRALEGGLGRMLDA